MARRKRRSSRVTFMHALEYSALRLLAVILRMVGPDAASGMMGRIWQAIGPRTKRQERVVANLRRAFPDKPVASLEAISNDQWNNLGRTFAESFLIEHLCHEDERFGFTPGTGEIIDGLVKSGKGFVVVSLHTANWELACMPMAKALKLTGLYQRISNPHSDQYVTGLRTKVFRGGLLAKSHGTPRKVMQIVRDGGGIAMLGDQRERKGVDVEFFGETTRAQPFPAMIARRLNVPLIAGRAIRLNGSRFVIDGTVIPVPHSDDVSTDIQIATQAIQRQFESWIREYPGQWMWIQDRWRPTGQRRRRKSATLDKSALNAN